MIKNMQRRDNKYKDLQGKPQKNINKKTNSELYFRYVYVLKAKFDIPYKFKTHSNDLLHNDLIDKPYYAFEGGEYILMTSNTKYYIDIKCRLPIQQHIKEVNTYGIHGANTYPLIQYINKYSVSKQNIQIII